MKKQKICIIGGGVTGLITAATLSKLNIEVDLVTENSNKILKSCRTTAISQENYEFLKKLKILNNIEKNFWSCSKMKLYADEKNRFLEIFEFNQRSTKSKKIFYMVENSKLIMDLSKKILNSKLIKFIVNKKISEIINIDFLKGFKIEKKISSKYNLIIVCTGNSSQLIKNFKADKIYKHDYDELAITTVIKHNFLANNIARQIFSNEGVLAFLPISNNKTSVVWSIKKNFIKNNNHYGIKKKIKFYAKNFFKKINFIYNLEMKELNLLVRKEYHSERILLFGDAIHSVHPLAGQGINMMLRDLKVLMKILYSKINLGLDVGSEDALLEFATMTKSKNFAYSLGIDLIRNSFKFEKKSIKKIRNKIIMQLNKNNIIKNIFYNIADKGLKF